MADFLSIYREVSDIWEDWEHRMVLYSPYDFGTESAIRNLFLKLVVWTLDQEEKNVSVEPIVIDLRDQCEIANDRDWNAYWDFVDENNPRIPMGWDNHYGNSGMEV